MPHLLLCSTEMELAHDFHSLLTSSLVGFSAGANLIPDL